MNPRGCGTATNEQELKKLPAYINPTQIANALIDITGIANAAPAQMKALIDQKISDPQLKDLLNGIVERSTGDIAMVRDQIAAWFDNGMDRVSGVYKRKTQVWSFAIVFLLAAGLNVSAINIGIALWQHPMLATTFAPYPSSRPIDALEQLQKLGVPVGWPYELPEKNAGDKQVNLIMPIGIKFILGWLITTISTLFGAPFWFDTLQQIVRLKGAGPSPAEKQSGASAAA